MTTAKEGNNILDASPVGDENSYVETFLRIAFPSDVPFCCRYAAMIFAAYLDESGTHKESATLIVAGYIALADEWIAFEVEWGAILAEYKLGAFHATDFASGAPPFDQLSSTEREECFDKLTVAINRHAWGGFAIAIPMDAYARMVSPAADKWLGGPYGMAMTRCFLEVADALSVVDPSREIIYVLEDGARGKGQVLKVYELNKGKPDLGILSLGFWDKRRFVPLQAADMLANELYREIARQRSKSGTVRPQLESLFAIPIIGGQMGEEDIAFWAKAGEAGAAANPHMTTKRARQLHRWFGP
jgi:hypothetical protein